jgi:crossover junction endonuclease MUS81
MDNILIFVDTRENALYDDIIDRDLDIYKDKISIVKETICIGDIHIKFNENLYIFERKTIRDLISSIHDGRYREQKARMLSTYNQKYLSYIIEEDDIISSKVYSKNKSTIQGAYINTLFRDNIRILFTKNISETVTLILSIAIKMIDNPKKFISSSNNANTEISTTSSMSQSFTDTSSYTDFIKLKKKKIDNIDVNTCYIMQLSQIPHISNVIAKNISKIYPNMIELITKLNDCEDKNKELCKIDGVGKEKASIIIKYLFC